MSNNYLNNKNPRQSVLLSREEIHLLLELLLCVYHTLDGEDLDGYLTARGMFKLDVHKQQDLHFSNLLYTVRAAANLEHLSLEDQS